MGRFIDAMLGFHMRRTAISRFEGYGTFCTFIKDLTMFVLNMTLQEGQRREKHFTMYTPEKNVMRENQ